MPLIFTKVPFGLSSVPSAFTMISFGGVPVVMVVGSLSNGNPVIGFNNTILPLESICIFNPDTFISVPSSFTVISFGGVPAVMVVGSLSNGTPVTGFKYTTLPLESICKGTPDTVVGFPVIGSIG